MKMISALTLGLAISVGATSAMAASCESSQRHKANRDALYGAVAGGLVGNSVSKGAGGILVGGATGAVVGHQIGKHQVKCGGGYYYRRSHRSYYHRHHR